MGIGFELRSDQGFDLLGEVGNTLAERHLMVASLGADSSVYIYLYHKIIKENARSILTSRVSRVPNIILILRMFLPG